MTHPHTLTEEFLDWSSPQLWCHMSWAASELAHLSGAFTMGMPLGLQPYATLTIRLESYKAMSVKLRKDTTDVHHQNSVDIPVCCCHLVLQCLET